MVDHAVSANCQRQICSIKSYEHINQRTSNHTLIVADLWCYDINLPFTQTPKPPTVPPACVMKSTA